MRDAEDRFDERGAKGAAARETLDLRGLKCPLPALRAAKALRRRADMTILVVLADDPLARLDIEHLCRAEGHALLAAETGEAGAVRLTIRRGETPGR